MYRRCLVGFIITSCLLVVLTCGASVWGVHRGLMRAPIGIARLGHFEVLAFTGVEFSTVRSARGYYSIWVGFRKDSSGFSQSWHPLIWAHQIVRLEVPPARSS